MFMFTHICLCICMYMFIHTRSFSQLAPKNKMIVVKMILSWDGRFSAAATLKLPRSVNIRKHNIYNIHINIQ